MMFDRDKDGLEAHGDLQSCRSSPGVREWMRLLAVCARSTEERSAHFVANLPKTTLTEKAEILPAAFNHGQVGVSRASRAMASFRSPWAHFLTAAPGLPSSDSSSSTLSKSLASRKFR